MKFSVKNPIPGFENIKEVEVTKIDDFFVKFLLTNNNNYSIITLSI